MTIIPHDHYFRKTGKTKIYTDKKRKVCSGPIYEYREHVCIYCGAVDWKPQGGEG